MSTKSAETQPPVPTAEKHSASSSTSQEVPARVLKKRESDRRCQRIKRERTKSKIAALEERVRNFGSQDRTGQVQSLIKQLQNVERERDSLVKKVKTIETVIRDSENGGVNATEEHTRSASRQASPSVLDTLDQDQADPRTEPHGCAPSPEVQESGLLDETENPPGINDHTGHYDPSAMETIPLAGTGIPEPFATDMSQPPEISTYIVHLQRGQSCECCSPQNSSNAKPKFNTWRYANEVLSSRFGWPEYCRFLQDEYRDDTPVRAVVEGWDVIESFGSVHSSWQILKKIDHVLLKGCGSKERLAVIIAIQVLLLSHTRSEAVPGFPGFYQQGPSQRMADSYAIHFFPWPGMRERFVFNQHRYCTNEFWNAFINGLRLTWPYEFRDSYTRNVETGLYSVSPLFQQHLNDITCWTIDIDVFRKWPELAADIPAYNRLPRSMSNWIRRPRLKAPAQQISRTAPEDHTKTGMALLSQTQPVQSFIPPEDLSAAAYYPQSTLYNMSEKAIPPIVDWTQIVPQVPPGAMTFYAPVTSALSVSIGF